MFSVQPHDVWQLRCEPSRAARLLSIPFENIVDRIHAESSVQRKLDEFGRTVLTLTLASELVDLFHNGAGGYRAQFYESIRQDEQANRYILDRLSHIDREILKSRTAKIWIYQGQWLRRQRHAMRNLRVERWHRNFHVCPKLVRYGYLTPDNETRLVIKGESPKSLDDRNERIYNYGYT